MTVGSYSCVVMPRKAAATRLTRPKSPLPRYVADSMMELMRHESIETTLRFYVGSDAQRTNDAIWSAFRRDQPQGATGFPDFSSDLAHSGAADAAPPKSVPCRKKRHESEVGPV